MLFLLLTVLVGCDAFLQGMHEEQARIDAERAAEQAAAQAPADTPEPTRLVAFGDPAVLPAEPRRDQARDWLAHHALCAIRDDHLAAGAAPPTVEVDALARAWSVLARAPSDDVGQRDRLLATCTFARAAGLSPDGRRAFLDATAFHRSIHDRVPPRPLVELLGWIGEVDSVDPQAALVAHLQVMEPDEVGLFLQQAGMMSLDEGEWDVDAAALAALPAPVLDAVEAAADAGTLGPRSGLTRALKQARGNR